VQTSIREFHLNLTYLLEVLEESEKFPKEKWFTKRVYSKLNKKLKKI